MSKDIHLFELVISETIFFFFKKKSIMPLFDTVHRNKWNACKIRADANNIKFSRENQKKKKLQYT